MAFDGAHHFNVEKFIAVDGQNPSQELKNLVDAACPGAYHRSAERGDAPKCHPETRQAVLNDIMSWVDSSSTDSKESLMWMSGPAGAGKSTIAQSVCEYYEGKKLLASFFFSRSAGGTGRGDWKRLIPTIAVQLAGAIPEIKGYIIEKLNRNPFLLSSSMEHQMQLLVLEPLETALVTLPNKDKIPYLIVIDGLDECFDRSMQAKIITMFAAIGSNTKIRFRCLIASRSELEIRNTFNLATTSDTCARLTLDENYSPDSDIRVYLRSEFSSLKRKHTLMSDLSQDSNWPTSKDIQWFVDKSSGQFIFASTIIKYLEDPRRNPRASLSAIINNEISRKGNDQNSPYSVLDALYMFILESAAFNLREKSRSLITVFQVLLFGYNSVVSIALQTLSGLKFFLSMETHELVLLLSDLHSVLFVPQHNDYSEGTKDIRFYHASLSDFLKDSSRSGQFFIDEKIANKALARQCFRVISANSLSRSIDSPASTVIHSCYLSYLLHIKEGGYSPLAVHFFLIRARLIMGFRWNTWNNPFLSF